MANKPITINNNSIIGELKKYERRCADAIAEFVWNAFDANANNVKISYDFDNKTEDGAGFGYPLLVISDDGDGWDMADIATVSTFLDSKKKALKTPSKSLPHGSKGVGRFAFHVFASQAVWTTHTGDKTFSLTLKRESISKYNIEYPDDNGEKGTCVEFSVDNDGINASFFEDTLPSRLLEVFAWFLVLYPDKSIKINDISIDPLKLIKDASDKEIFVDNEKISVKLIQWERSLSDKENSKDYFIGSDGSEVFKCPSGLNNKQDVFYHSAYICSEKFDGYQPTVDDLDTDKESLQLGLFDANEQKKFINKVKVEVRKLLEEFRTPYIESVSHEIIQKFKDEKIMPNPEDYRVDEKDFNELVRQTYVIAPDMYTGVSDDNKKLLLNLMASLMGTSEKSIILKAIEHIYNMTDTQRQALSELLDRTTLGNIVVTINEIDHRLQTIEDLDRIVLDPEKYKTTLEVKHLQKILDNEFWVFGEQFRLVSSTEGSIKKAIDELARTVLDINYSSDSDSKKELDLLLSKKIEVPNDNGSAQVQNIVVELKRPSKKLGKEEYDQIEKYHDDLLKDKACNGSNMKWTFILVGSDYDEYIGHKIEGSKSWGESELGLTQYLDSKRSKIYVRKWSDIIHCELKPKYKYLKDKLNIQLKNNESLSQDEIAGQHEQNKKVGL